MLVGLVIGLLLIPGIAFAFGTMMNLTGLGRILFTICQLTGVGSVLEQADDGPTYRLRALADPYDEGEPTHVYLGQDEEGEPAFRQLGDGEYYRLGKRPFGLSFDPDGSWLYPHRVWRSADGSDGGAILTSEERGGVPLWTPFAEAQRRIVCRLDRLGVFGGDYESLRQVVRKELPEAGDRSSIGDFYLIGLSAGLMVVFFVITLFLF